MSDMFDDAPELDFDSFDTEAVDPSKCDSTPQVDKVGKYHFLITKVKPRPEKSTDDGKARRPDILLTCHVLKTVKGQSPEGSVYFHNIIAGGKGGGPIDEDWAKNSTCAFLSGVGLLNKVGTGDDAKFIDPTTNSTVINFGQICKRLENLQFIGDIKKNRSDDPQYDDKYELMFGRGAYPVNHPAVADVPKNAEALPASPPAGQGEGPNPQAPAQPQQMPSQDVSGELAGL